MGPDSYADLFHPGNAQESYGNAARYSFPGNLAICLQATPILCGTNLAEPRGAALHTTFNPLAA